MCAYVCAQVSAFGNRVFACGVFLLPGSVGGVVPLLLPELVECVVDGAADLVADLPELLAEGERPFALVPVLIPFAPV